MTDFTASNGIKVENFTHFSGLRRIIADKNGLREIDVAVTADVVEALIEALDHEHDEELGRWRYPANPLFVVYGGYSPGEEKRFARVLHEQTGVSSIFYEGVGYGREENEIAAAYFEAHPERKPWQDAKPGEVWALTVEGTESAFYPSKSLNRAFTPVAPETGRTAVLMDSFEITDGRKLFPEDAS